MSQIIFTSTTQPPNDQAKNVGNQHGRINIKAVATGTGTWSTIFNYAPVYPDGLGEVGQITVSNTTPMAELTGATSNAAFIGWFSGDVGTVLTRSGCIVG